MISSNKNNKIKSTISITIITMITCIFFTGCSITDYTLNKICEYGSKDKIVCTVNEADATQIVYDEVTYQVLSETVDRSEIGGWRGVFKKITVLDENYSIINQVKMKATPTSQIKDILKDLPQKAKYIVPFYNVLSIKDTDDDEAIVVQLFSDFYKAVPVELKNEDEERITFTEETIEEITTKFEW